MYIVQDYSEKQTISIATFFLLSTTIASEFLIFKMGLLTSNFYLYSINKDLALFKQLCINALLLILLLSFIKSIMHYTAGRLSLTLRSLITLNLHPLYISKKNLYWVQDKCDNPDQRITQDIQLLTQDFRVLLEALCINPLLIIYYTYKTIDISGSYHAPVIILVYFIITVCIARPLLKQLVAINIDKEKREGDFRFMHVNSRLYAEEISLWKGYTSTIELVGNGFTDLYDITKRSLGMEAPLKMVVEMTSYSGAVLVYIIIGITVFSSIENKAVQGEGELAQYISQYAFMCMYLLYRFTVLSEYFEVGARGLSVYKRLSVFYTLLLDQDINHNRKPSAVDETSVLLDILVDNVELEEKYTSCHSQLFSHINTTRDITIKDYTPESHYPIKLHGFNIDLKYNAPPDIMWVNGPNGIGKSCLLRSLADLEGSLGEFIGNDRNEGDNTDICFMPQRVYWIPGGNLKQQLSFPGKEISEEKYEAVKRVLRIKESSGYSEGEKRKIMLGRAVCGNARWCFMDEPGSGMSTIEEQRLLEWAVKSGLGCIVFTHGIVNETCDKRITIEDDGRCILIYSNTRNISGGNVNLVT